MYQEQARWVTFISRQDKGGSLVPIRNERSFFPGRVFRSVLSNWSCLFLNATVALVLTPYVVRHLGDAAYGIWALVLQLTGYMGIVDVGLRSALVRFVSSTHARKEFDGLNRLLSSTILIYAIMVPLSLLTGILLAVFALPRMHIAPEGLRTAQVTLFIAAMIIACDFLFATFHASLAGLSRWDLINAVSVSGILVRAGLIILFLEAGYGLITLALIQFSVTLAGYLVEILILKRLVPTFQILWEVPDWEHLRPVLSHSWYSLLLSLANSLNYRVDTIVIAAFLPIEQVTFYVIGLRLIEFFRDLLNSTTMVTSPLVSSYEALGESHRTTTMLIRSTKYSLIIGFLGVAGFLILGTDFIRLWMGPRFAGPSGRVLAILTLGLMVSATQYASSHILYGLSQHKINMKWTVVESILNIALSITLIRKYGIFGVAAGTSISNLLIRGFLFPRSVLSTLGVSWKRYLRDGIVPSIFPALSFAIVVLCFKVVFPIHSYLELVLVPLLGVFPALCFLWLVTFDAQEREFIRVRTGQLALRK
jgi:O-antigen/teichoic acid export membrane protein